ncbi:MAG: SBBP repeat-containing protein [Terriglobia bacterium]
MRRFVPVASALVVLVLLAVAAVMWIDQTSPRGEANHPVNHLFRAASKINLRARGTTETLGKTGMHSLKSFGDIPLSFEANQGQTDRQVKFLSRGRGYGLFLTASEAVLTLSPGSQSISKKGKVEDGYSLLRQPLASSPPDRPVPSVLRMKVVGANPQAAVKGLDQLSGYSNYYFGNDPKKWRTNVPSYARVKYEGVYTGVDLVYYGNQRQLEYDFVVAPGADPRVIELELENGNSKLETGRAKIDARGDLVIATKGGEVRFHKPVVYQPDNPKSEIQNRKSVEGRFKLLAANRVGFELGPYDKSLPLVIDPALNYATFLGGNSYDAALGVAADAAGNAYVVGTTFSSDFPVTNGGTMNNGDAFVTKLNPAGTATVYSTFIGGSSSEDGFAIAVDGSGNAYITGDTYSGDFPTTTGAFHTLCSGTADCNGGLSGDAFVTKLDATGAVSYSTFVGGNKDDAGYAIAVNSAGDIAMTGVTNSPIIDISRGFQSTCGSCGTSLYDAYVVKLHPAGDGINDLLYASYLGGNAEDKGNGIAFDSAGKMWVIGTTDSTDFPTSLTAPVPTDPDSGTASDAFITEIDPTLTSTATLLFSTYLGDASTDYGTSLAFDNTGMLYIAGLTDFAHIPTETTGFQTDNAGGFDVFVAKINPATAQYVYATLLGGSADEGVRGLAVDTSGHAYVTGSTSSPDFPLASAVDSTHNTSGVDDAFVTEIAADGMSLVFSTYLGGEGYDAGQGIAVNSAGQIFVVGTTGSSDFPASTGVLQGVCGDTGCSQGDGFVASYGAPSTAGAVISLDPTSVDFGNQVVGSTSSAHTITLHNTGNATLNISGITITGENADAFGQTHTCGSSVAADASCTISATFTPSATGGASATINIASDATSGPTSVSLSGSGVDLTITPGEGSSTSATVAAGASATYGLTILGSTGVTGDANLTCTGAPAHATCTVNPTTVTLSDTTPAAFTVSVATTARSVAVPVEMKVPPVSGQRAPYSQPIQVVSLLSLLTMAALALGSRRRAKWLLAATMLVVLMWSACGGNESNNPPPQTGTPAGTYTLNVTATTAAGSKSTSLSLTVN